MGSRPPHKEVVTADKGVAKVVHKLRRLQQAAMRILRGLAFGFGVQGLVLSDLGVRVGDFG